MTGDRGDGVPDPGTGETLAFVLGELGDGTPLDILEVGAGDGALASELVARGHRVVALDASYELVRTARLRRVDARVAKWPDFEGGPFDRVLFTRSLHHIDPLPEAVEKAAILLKPDGRVVVEDFAFHDMDEVSIGWFRDRLLELRSAGDLKDDPESFPWRILDAADPVDAWGRDADHLHPSEALRTHLSRCFALEREARAPYLYRYIAALVPEEALSSFLADEREAIAEDTISALGWRWVGRSR